MNTMKYLHFFAAFLAAFLLSGCAGNSRTVEASNRAEDAALTAFELAKERANKIFDQQLLQHQKNAEQLERFGRALGRIK